MRRLTLAICLWAATAHADDAKLYFKLGVEAKQRGDLAAAMVQFNRCLAVAPEDARCLYSLGLAHKKQGNLAEARAHCERAAKAAPTWGPPWLTLGQILLKAGEEDAAVQAFEAALARQELSNDEQAECWNGLGIVRRRREDWPGAREAYDKAIALAPQNGLYRTNAGLAMLKAGNAAGAEAHLRVATSVTPQSFEAWSALGAALGDQQKWAGAAEAYAKAVELDPKASGTWFELASVRLLAGDVEGAVLAYLRQRETAPGAAKRAGEAQLQTLRRNLAIALLRRARDLLDPGDPARDAFAEAELSVRKVLGEPPDLPVGKPSTDPREARLNEARAAAARALEILPQDLRLEQAVEACRRAAKAVPQR